jgi:hypothetical protein
MTSARSYGPLKAGQSYCVIQAFTDYDGSRHEVGESWTYLDHYYFTHEDGLCLFVSLDGKQEWRFRLQDRPEEQGAIVRGLHEGVMVKAV